MPPVRITDLPTEILVALLEHPTFPTRSLYFLALLCRRLNLIALPIYFSRSSGIDLNAKSAAISMHAEGVDALSALQICSFISSMERIECIFPHPSCTSIFPFLKQMTRVKTFISRLSSVKEVTLNLDYTQRAQCLAFGTDEVLHAWGTQLRDLLSCIVNKGCTSITVVNGTHLIEAYKLDPPEVRQKYLPRLLRRLFVSRDAKMFGFRRDSSQGTDDVLFSMPSFRKPASKLNALRIDSMTLVLPPGLHWTLAAMRHSPITSLSIRISLVQLHIWETVLPLLASAAPKLTTVSLKELDTPSEFRDARDEPTALAFLASLPRLTSVELTHRHALWDRSGRTKGPTSSYTHVTTLRAPANVVAHLLSRPSSFRALREICVLWIAPAHAHVQKLMEFLSTITRTLAARSLTPKLSLWIESPGRLYDQDAFALQNITEAQLACLARVEYIHFERPWVPQGHTVRQLLGSMLAVFRGVTHVSVTSYAHAASVVRIMREVRPTEVLKTVELNGKTYIPPKD
ncbi:hypothetical protein B0H19DRAFT_1193007 [Mycena capillaripes]|nr:hypothetical protein B0H19DRAFT_1193007 [Mycena capillaripes]